MIVSTIVLPEEPENLCAHHWIITSAVSSKLVRRFEFACWFSKVFFETFDRDLRNFLSTSRSARLVARAWIRIDSKRDRGAKPQEGFRRELRTPAIHENGNVNDASANRAEFFQREAECRIVQWLWMENSGKQVSSNPAKLYRANLPCITFLYFFFFR